MKDSNIAIPPLPPGLAHSVSPTALSTWSEASVFSQSTGYEEKVRGDRVLRGGERERERSQLKYSFASRRTANFKSGGGKTRSCPPCSPRERTARNRCINRGDEATKQTPAALI